MKELQTKIGLEIHVQLKTKSKMFCGCDNQSFAEATDGKQCLAVEPNSLVCPVCLGQPGSLPVANKQAIEWTIKTGLALNCEIPKIAKFDRKHYFYPDLPKGYQISQYDEPFCVGGFVELRSDVISNDSEKSHEISRLDESTARNDNRVRINLTRIHLEEDAGKLIHRGNQSLVDLNRAGTPLMEIVTEPDITSPAMAGDFLRKLQKIVRDVVEVSEASMEKGHLRCDANISVSEMQPPTTDHRPPTALRMSPIIEIKNLNSFKFVEKALALVEAQLKDEHEDWPEKNTKETWGYDSVSNKVYLQRRKEEAADYRYFPEPDLPPIDTTRFDHSVLKQGVAQTEEVKIQEIVALGIAESDARVLVGDKTKRVFFESISQELSHGEKAVAAKAIVHRYFPFDLTGEDLNNVFEYAKAISALSAGQLSKAHFSDVVTKIRAGSDFKSAAQEFIEAGELDLASLVDEIFKDNAKELERYRAGEKQLLGFFMGQLMKKTGGKVNPQEANKILKDRLENK